MKRPAPRICTARNDVEGYAACERPFGHDGWHRAELGPAESHIGERGELIFEAQVISWSPD